MNKKRIFTMLAALIVLLPLSAQAAGGPDIPAPPRGGVGVLEFLQGLFMSILNFLTGLFGSLPGFFGR